MTFCPPTTDPAAVLAALLRSPLANLSQITQGSKKPVPPRTEIQIGQVNGLPGQAQTWIVHIAPEPNQQPYENLPIAGANPWTQGRIRWTVGNAVHEAVIDLQGGTTLALAFDTLSVWIRDTRPPEPIWNDQAPIVWNVSIATALGAVPPALPTRTIRGTGEQVIAIPAFARSVTPLLPSGAVAYTLNLNDPTGAIIGSAFGTPGTQPPPTIDIPQGAQFAQLLGGPNIQWALVFRLSL